MSLSSLSIQDIFQNISNSFIYLITTMYNPTDTVVPTNSETSNAETVELLKQNRYMYLALLAIVILLIGNLLFTSE